MRITIVIKAPNSSTTDTNVPTIARTEDLTEEMAERETESSQILDYNDISTEMQLAIIIIAGPFFFWQF